MIAENTLALNAGWDREHLDAEPERLLAEDLDFDIGIANFSIGETVMLIEGTIETTKPETSRAGW